MVIGASSLLGKKLMKVLSSSHDIGGTYFQNSITNSKFLDITDKEEVYKFTNLYSPDWIINTSALTNVDYCEKHQDEAWQINVDGTHNLVLACKSIGAKFMQISSDYVFDGTGSSYDENTIPNPVNYYGITKLESERIVIDELYHYAIIRPSILYGYNDDKDKETFVTFVRKNLHKNKLEVDNEIIKYPVLIDDIAKLVDAIITQDLKGTFNIGGTEGYTRYEWAQKIMETVSAETTMKLIPVISDNTGKKPKNVKFTNDKVKNIGIKLTGVNEGLDIIDKQEKCFFKLIYSVRPDILVLNESASQFRINAGKALAKESAVSADIVVPVPESGMFPATGFSSETGIPLVFGIIRDYYTKRTLFDTKYESRITSLKRKLIAVPSVLKDKNIILIDEAIISGSTLKIAVEKVKECGVKEIHIRIPSPPMIYQCPARMMPNNIDLVTHKLFHSSATEASQNEIEKEMAKYFEVDSVNYLSIEGILNSTTRKEWCLHCLKGD